jgi:hypothetical protein
MDGDIYFEEIRLLLDYKADVNLDLGTSDSCKKRLQKV